MPDSQPNGGSPAIMESTAQGNPAQGDSRLDEQMRALAGQPVTFGRGARRYRPLAERLRGVETLVRAAYQQFSQASAAQAILPYAAEWLLDNYYVVQQAIRQIREDLPQGYYRELPKLAVPPLQGLPRVYALAREMLQLAKAQIDLEQIIRSVDEFQQVAPLTMGELWALPIMLRLVAVESLAGSVGRLAGLAVPPSLLGDGGEAAPKSSAERGDRGEGSGPSPSQGEGRARVGSTSAAPSPSKADDEATVANAVLSLRAMSAYTWKDFFERLSLVEGALSKDPARLYTGMEFDTRDRYRKAVEKLAVAAGTAEVNVARAAVGLAVAEAERQGVTLPGEEPWAGLDAPRAVHVGYYLIGAGRSRLEAQIGARYPWPRRFGRRLLAHPTPTYLGGIALLIVVFELALILYAVAAGSKAWLVVVAALFGLLPMTTAAVDVVNWLVTLLVKPRVLPKLDFEDGIPADAQAMVVIPALLATPGDADSLLRRIELHYLSNPDPNLSFALLTDFADAPQKEMPGDAELLALAEAGIRALNDKYAASGRRPFYFFHRERLWNPREGVWMAWERKRGKLHEFNRLLLGGGKTSYTVQIGEPGVLRHIRYVITLDADTSLPWESGERMIGTLAHPLNRAELDESNRVIAGYTLLQPRIEIRPTSADNSEFTRIYAGDTGLDLYTLAVSDVYQDLFGEGIFVGKGIYDVEAFECSLAGRIPDNALLSHDLFEGIHGRTGLVTDIVLYEDYPPHYLAHARRLDRWIRGDWQLLPWLLPRVPSGASGASAGGGMVRNPLSTIDRWKIVDNLRRSLLAPTLLALLIGGWLFLPGSPLIWTLVAILAAAVPVLTGVGTGLVVGAAQGSLAGLGRSVGSTVARWLLALVFLPFEALLAIEAIITTLVRLVITRRHLLKWTTAAHTASLFGPEAGAKLTWREMAPSVVMALGLGALVAVIRLPALPAAAPLLLAWLISPQVAHWISRPIVHEEPPLTEEQHEVLRHLARRTWLFFERFVGPDDQWLPPDHFQEDPRGTVAHRTSPTNVGLLLLSTLGSFDLGYLGLLGMALRLRDTFETMDRMERHRGHFLNWYDTHSLAPLPARYVSTVDSGNLAASLLALAQGCLETARQPVLRWERWEGLVDTLALLAEGLPESTAPQVRGVQDHLAELRQRVEAARGDPSGWPALLADAAGDGWQTLNARLTDLVDAGISGVGVNELRELRLLAERVQHHLVSMQREYDLLVPWLPLLATQPAWPGDPALEADWQAIASDLPPTVALGDLAGAAREAHTLLASLKEHLDQVTARSNTSPGAAGDASPADGRATVETDTPTNDAAVGPARNWLGQLEQALEAGRMGAGSLIAAYESLAGQAQAYVQAMDFRFLFDPDRQVFHIGYNVDAGQLDRNYYDLLASESRIASLVAIAKGDVPSSHWLHLARPVTKVAGMTALLSWSGTMFEYMMPGLLVPDYAGTFLAESGRAAVLYQIAYARQKGVPWGISESGYYHFDANMNYQYRAFGVPGLGFKRGLADDLVITPYASLLALATAPAAVLDNLEHLDKLRMRGRFGYYEAIDFTQSRLDIGQKSARIQSYMAHHQGMILVSLANFLHGNVMIDLLQRDPRLQTVDLLLQERVPPAGQTPIEYPSPEDAGSALPLQPAPPLQPWRVPVDGPVPEVHHLSNGRYSVLITSGGGGFSRWQSTDLTRWRADTTLDDWGTWIYLQDLERDSLWSLTAQPMGLALGNPDVLYFPHKAEFRHQLDDGRLTAVMEIAVPPDDDLEIRRVTVTNHGDRPRRLRLTSYGEVILGSQIADRRHQAFNKLFVESEYLPELNGLLFRRRPRSADEQAVYMAHWLAADQGVRITGGYETDRERFLGRGRTTRNPAALEGNGEAYLSGTVGATLDPVMALGQEVELEPYGTVQLAFFTAAAGSREELADLAGRYQSLAPIERALDQARAASERELRALGLDTPALERVEQLYSVMLYPYAGLRADPATLAANSKGQPGLWAYSISGDYLIALVRVEGEDDLPLVRELLQAHAYWRHRGIQVDLVILNQRDTSYAQELQDQLNRAIAVTDGQAWLNRRGGIFLLSGQHVPEADQVLLATAARAVLDGSKGSLAEQLRSFRSQPARLPAFVPTLSETEHGEPEAAVVRPDGLLFDNGLGGFTTDGREYIVYVDPGDAHGQHVTPAPWVNIVANPRAGFIVSESGFGYSWAENSGENRLTPWANDPVSDWPGEAIYLRDEETGVIWSPTPLPAGAPGPTLVRHGAGYTTFDHHSHGLHQQLRLFAAPGEEPVKIIQLHLENTWDRVRRITATYYAEWVLGTTHDETQPYILPEYYQAGNALLARNPYNAEFGDSVAFAAASQPLHGVTADRAEFLGRMGSLARPAALLRIGPANSVQPGLDPCAAIQIHANLQPGEALDVHFLLGEGQDRDEALRLIGKYIDPGQVEAAWQATRAFWDELLGTVTVHTPDPAMDLLLNRWLLYEDLSCRLWGRSALYQSSGAYGFRDQLQDAMALALAAPHLEREQILRAARHQFEAGDVLHWWHPPSGRGIRSRCSDDLLWLPFVTAHYVASTGDRGILSEQVPFMKGPALEAGQDERYGQYEQTAESYSLLDHCRRAIARGSTSGPHGLPLIGSGDWNDGLNRVGAEGRGESVWDAWFLYAVLVAFAALEDELGDGKQAAAYRQQAGDLRRAIEGNTWDGHWYLRAFYDDGTPLGSARNRECQIDSIAQSWAVLSGAGDPAHAAEAMESVDQRLVHAEDRLILLFTPPFDQTSRDPGYIKGYVPGIRENGGQYTHAAIWAVWATTELGQGDRAAALFRILNPITHADSPAKASRYRVEPYVVASDVYSVPPHTGRGGWTWYTGSAGWMYRLGIEAILGLARLGDALTLSPCIPRAWPGYELTVRHGRSQYHIVVDNPDHVERGVREISLDGQPVPARPGAIALRDDGKMHEVRVRLGPPETEEPAGPEANGQRFVPVLSGQPEGKK